MISPCAVLVMAASIAARLAAGPALLILFAAALATGLGRLPFEGLRGLLLGSLGVCLCWVLWLGGIAFGLMAMGRPDPLGPLLRALGFAAAPFALGLLAQVTLRQSAFSLPLAVAAPLAAVLLFGPALYEQRHLATAYDPVEGPFETRAGSERNKRRGLNLDRMGVTPPRIRRWPTGRRRGCSSATSRRCCRTRACSGC